MVSGFFIADSRTIFDIAMGATVLPKLDEIDPNKFLPSSRSIAFKKSAWEAIGGYPEWLDYCEDLVFDIALKNKGFAFQFNPKALVWFRPRPNLRSFFKQYYLYARGDGKALLWTKRHLIRYMSYILGTSAMIMGVRHKILWVLMLIAGFYYLYRPYKRLFMEFKTLSITSKIIAFILVPLIRLTGDIAKMLGYPVGLYWRYRNRKKIN